MSAYAFFVLAGMIWPLAVALPGARALAQDVHAREHAQPSEHAPALEQFPSSEHLPTASSPSETPIFVDFPALPAPPSIDADVARDLAAERLLHPAPAAPEAVSGVIAVILREPVVGADPMPTAAQDITLPLMPEVVVVLDVPAQEPMPALMDVPVVLDLPDVPAVIVAVEPPVPVVDPARVVAVAPSAPVVHETRIRDVVEPLRVQFKLKPTVTDGFVAAYAARQGQTLWLSEGKVLPAVAALKAHIQRADEDGLNVQRLLSLWPLDASVTSNVLDEKRADIDIALSFVAYMYVQDARGGRIEPSRLSSLLTPNLSLPFPVELMARLGQAGPEGVRDVLASYQPVHAGYKALKAKLADLRADLIASRDVTGSTGASPLLVSGFMGQGLIVPGKADPRVPLLRMRLNQPASDDTLYDAALQDAVREFQRANGLKPDARITPKTRDALEDVRAPVTRADKKLDPEARLTSVIANMERWRWLPQDLGKTHIFVNVPNYQLNMVSDGAVIHQTRVIVGKPETQTPIFSDEMQFLIVNPSWYVPPSIMKKEFIPRLALDPEYASKRGYEVIRRGNSVSVRQPPGERNALGHIKFMFPNQHAVYLHDTPTRHLFRNDARAFSHGCVRVEGPFHLAERLLLEKQGFTEKTLRAMVGRGERMIKLNERVPVHLTYFTHFVDETGALVTRNDLYGHDLRIKKALSL